jgi:hypothetical protein
MQKGGQKAAPHLPQRSKRAFRRDVAKDRDSEPGDCPNGGRSYDYGEPERARLRLKLARGRLAPFTLTNGEIFATRHCGCPTPHA